MMNLYLYIGLTILILGGSKLIYNKYKNNSKDTFKKWYYLVNKLNHHFNMDESIALAIIHVESNGNPKAVGDNGNSIGLMQVTQPALSDVNEFFGKNFSLSELVHNPENQIYAGMAYFNIVYRRAEQNIDLAIRGYNAGLRRAKENDSISQSYLIKVKKYAEIFKQYIGGVNVNV
ncbi:MAG: transglycosylase SLT domain-containing protein [Candidatus Lokiarchaeota archaeon]|nr:transglycosylase SLT domain-containing protein [Candidatus Lokiarchaeota archaeon]